jgi:hypothetical protein
MLLLRNLLLSGIFALCAAAQVPSQPPTLIRLIRNGSFRPYSTARAPVTLFGMKSVSGYQETWLMEAHDSFASIESLDKVLSNAMEADSPAGPKTMIALYRPGLSYRPDEAIRLYPKARFFQVTIYRLNGGSNHEFIEMMRLRRQSQDSVNLNRPEVAYQVMSGAESGLFVFFGPLPSLSVLDTGMANSPVYAEDLLDARAELRQKVSGEIIRENLLFRIDPRISNVSEAFANGESEFWHGKKKQP